MMFWLRILSLFILTSSSVSSATDIYGRESKTPLNIDVRDYITNQATFEEKMLEMDSNIFYDFLTAYVFAEAPNPANFDLNNAVNYGRLVNAVGWLQALQSKVVDYGSDLHKAPARPNADGSNYETEEGSLADFIYIALVYTNFAINMQGANGGRLYDSYNTQLQEDSANLYNLLIFLISGKTKAEVDELDARSKAAEVAGELQAYFEKGFQDFMLYLAEPVYDAVDEKWTEKAGFLTVDDQGALRCDPTLQHSRKSFFRIATVTGSKTILLQVPSVSKSFLAEKNPDEININATKETKKQDSKIMLTGTSTEAANVFFDMIDVPGGIVAGMPKGFSLQARVSKGFMFAESDDYVRTYMSNLAKYTIDHRVVIRAFPVNQLAQSFAAALESVGASNIIGKLKAIVSAEPQQIRSRSDIVAFVNVLYNLFHKAASSPNPADFEGFVSLQNTMIIPMLIQLRKSFMSEWTVADAALENPLISLTKMLGPNSVETDTDSNHALNLQQGVLLQKLAQTSSLAYSNYVANFINAFDTSFSPQKIDEILVLFKVLIDQKAYAQNSDLGVVLDKVNSDDFKIKLLTIDGVKNLFQPYINQMNADVTFTDHYKVFEDLIKKSQQSISVLSDYHKTLLKEKIKIIEDSGGKAFVAGVKYEDIRQLMIMLRASSIALSLDITDIRVENFLSNLKSGILNQQQLSMPFADRVKGLGDKLAGMKTGDDAVTFYDLAVALLSHRVEGSTKDLTDFSTTLQTASYTSPFANLYNTKKGVENGADLLKNLIVKLSDPITNLERAEWMMYLLDRDTLDDRHKVLVGRVFGEFLASASADSSGSSKLIPLSEVAFKASLTTMRQVDQFRSLLDQLKTLIDQTAAMRVSVDVQNLKDSLASAYINIPMFMASATSIVSRKMDITEADSAEMIKILSAFKFKVDQVSLSTPWKEGDSQPLESSVTELLSKLKTAPTFGERVENIATFYAGLNPVAASIPEESKQKFMDKLVKAMAAKEDKYVRATDTGEDSVYRLISLVQTAAYNKIASRQTALLSIAEKLISYRNGVKEALPVPFSEKFRNMKALLPTMETRMDAQRFLQMTKDLVKYRVQGSKQRLLEIQAWLNSPGVVNQPAMFTSGYTTMGEDGSPSVIAQLAKALLDPPIEVNVLLAELSRMIETYGTFDAEQKREFLAKLSDLVNRRREFKESGLNKDNITAIIDYAEVNIFGQRDDLDTLKSTLKTFNPDAEIEGIIFSERLTNLRDSLENIIDEASARKFVENANALVVDIVDATQKDVDDFVLLLKSNKLMTNEKLLFTFGNFDFISKMLEKIAEPVSYIDRVTNLTNFVKLRMAFDRAEKDLFIAKCSLLFERRGEAEVAKFNLADLQTFLNVVKKNRFTPGVPGKPNPDQKYIDQIDTIYKSLLTPPERAVQSMNFNFKQDLDDIVDAFDKVVDGKTLADLINKINDVSTRRVNAIMIDASTDQAKAFYDQFVDAGNLNSNEFLFGNDGAKDQVLKAAARLIEPVSFVDMFNNLKLYVKSFTTFTYDVGELFKSKLDKVVKHSELGKKEAFREQDLVDLINKVNVDRFTNDHDINKLKEQYLSGSVVTSATYEQNAFTNRFDRLVKNFFPNNTSPNDANLELVLTPDRTIAKLVEEIEDLTKQKADSSESELNGLRNILKEIKGNWDLNKPENSALKLIYTTSVQALSKPITFVELANNLEDMVFRLPTFTDGQKTRFIQKLKRIVDNRIEGYNSGYEMEKLFGAIEVVLDTQMKNNQVVSNQYAALKIRPSTTKMDDFVSYSDLLEAKKKELAAFGNDMAQRYAVADWVNRLQEVVNVKVDGLMYDTAKKIDDRAMLLDFDKFLNETVRYNPGVFNLEPEKKVDEYLKQLRQPPKFAELVENLTNMVNKSNLFSPRHKSMLVNKLDRIIDRRASSTSEQMTTLSRIVNFAKVSKFMTETDGQFLDGYIARLQSAPSQAEKAFAEGMENAKAVVPGGTGAATELDDAGNELSKNISELEGFVPTINISNLGQVKDADRAGWVSKIKRFVYKLKTKAGTDGKVAGPYIDITNRAMGAARSLKSRVFSRMQQTSTNLEFQADLDSQIEQLRVMV